MTTAAEAPQSQPGGGSVVQETNARHQRQVTRRKTNFLSTLPPEARKAFLQEQLNQSAIIRQIACMKHGVLGPTEREVIGPMPSEEEFEEVSTDTGVSIEELRRREELARREAMVEAHEQMLAAKQAEAEANAKPVETINAVQPVPTPAPVKATGISESEARAREELAKCQAHLEAMKAGKTGIGTDPPVGTHTKTSTTTNKTWTQTLKRVPGWAIGGVGGLSTAAAIAMWMSGAHMPAIPGTTPAAVSPAANASDDEKILALLQTHNVTAPKTPLGEQLLEAMARDPEFRVRIMQDAEAILKNE